MPIKWKTPRSPGCGFEPAVLQRRLRGWFEDTPGCWALEAEADVLSGILPNLFGYHLLQVGVSLGSGLLAETRIRNCVVVSEDDTAPELGYPMIRASAGALPVMSDSVDVFLLSHVLEFESNPHQALREAERVLVPEGHLLIAGFNPWSMVGVRRLLSGRSPDVPWCGHFLSLTRIRDWLALLGFDTLRTTSCFFRPPLGNRRTMSRLTGLDTVGGRLSSLRGGIYVVLARKRVSTLTPIRPRWRPHRNLVSAGLARPSTRAAARTGVYVARPGPTVGSPRISMPTAGARADG